MKKLLIIALLLLIPSMAFAVAGTATQTWTSVNNSVSSLTFAWTANSGTGAMPAIASESNIDGYVFMVVTNPGTTAPTDDYDITLTDSDGVDVMGGKLVDRDTANSEQTIPLVGSGLGSRFVSGVLTMNISGNIVHSATGTVTVFIYNER